MSVHTKTLISTNVHIYEDNLSSVKRYKERSDISKFNYIFEFITQILNNIEYFSLRDSII